MPNRCRKLNKEKKSVDDDNISDISDIIEKNNLNDKEFEKISKGEILEKIYYFIENISYKFIKAIIFLFKASCIYILWIFLHYFSAHLYIKFCVPNTVIGFIMSPFMISTPHCQGLRWIVYNAVSVINNMWIIVGAWIYSVIWIFNNDTSSNVSNN